MAEDRHKHSNDCFTVELICPKTLHSALGSVSRQGRQLEVRHVRPPGPPSGALHSQCEDVWLLMTAIPQETPIPAAASPRDGDRPGSSAFLAGVEAPGSISVVAASSRGVAAASGPSENQKRDNRFCGRHGFLAAGCMYCADPVLEHEMYLAAEAVIGEFGRPW